LTPSDSEEEKTSKPETNGSAPNIWWVNQGSHYDEEKSNGFKSNGFKSNGAISNGIICAPSDSSHSHWNRLKEIRQGDVILHYVKKNLLAVSKATASYTVEPRPYPLGDLVYLVKTEYHPLAPPIPFSKFSTDLRQLDIYEGPIDKNGNVKQGYLFRFNIEALKLIMASQPDTKWPKIVIVLIDPKGGVKIKELKSLLKSKPQIILAGPPGTSKTYMAFQIIALLGNEEFGIEEDPIDSIFKPPCMQFDSSASIVQNGIKVVWDIVQFHPSYGYEDFVSGIEANSENGALNFERKKRIFIKIVEAAKENPSIQYVLIIDEINRGLLGRIFGELILTLEYRNLGVRLLGQNERITIPDNLYLIGTMNTADRNISLVDHALRRRFLIVECLPDGDLLNGYLEKNLTLDYSKRNTIKEIFKAVQKAFYKENTYEYERDQRGYFMGDYAIGHTYFMIKDIEDLWTNLRYQVIPLLEEYRKEGIITEDHLRRTALHIQGITIDKDTIDSDTRGNVKWLKDWCEKCH
jgi:DNA polymerase III delta prime subunit